MARVALYGRYLVSFDIATRRRRWPRAAAYALFLMARRRHKYHAEAMLLNTLRRTLYDQEMPL